MVMIKNINNIYFTIEKNEVLNGEWIELQNILILMSVSIIQRSENYF